jgi:hypothetical protein
MAYPNCNSFIPLVLAVHRERQNHAGLLDYRLMFSKFNFAFAAIFTYFIHPDPL